MCRDVDCPKNHLECYMEHGVHKMDASLEHYKNDNIKGSQHIPLAPKYIPMLVLLEQATQVSQGGMCPLQCGPCNGGMCPLL